MTRVATLVAAVAVALAAGSAAPAKMEGRLFGIVGTEAAQYVAELDPETLRPLPGRRVQIGFGGAPMPWSHDPTRRFLAVAVGDRLRVVDLSRLRVLRVAKLGLEARPFGVLWARGDRIVVLQHVGGVMEVRTLDARRLTLLSRTPGGNGVDGERSECELTLLLAPPYTIGPARLVVVGADGEVRELTLDRIRAGSRWEDVDPPVGEQQRPALAANGSSLYVVSPDGVAAEVNAQAQTVRYRALHGRFAKVLAGAWREAFVLDGRLVVSGTNATTSSAVVSSTGIGVEVVDLATWTTTRIPSATSSIARWRDAIVATGGTWHSENGHRGEGIRIYGLDGKERLRALSGQRLWLAAVHGDRAYAYVDGTTARLAVVDLVSGALSWRSPTSMPWLLLEQGSQVW